MPTTRRPQTISNQLIDTISERLEQDLQVRRTLPAGGRVNIDRQLPFLVLYRPPAGEDVGTARFVRGEASSMIAPRGKSHQAAASKLLSAIASTMVGVFGQFLVIEVWAGSDEEARPSETGTPQHPGFRVITPRHSREAPSVTRLVRELEQVRVLKRAAEVELVPGGRLSPPEMPRAVASFGRRDSPVHMIGLEIKPIYRDGDAGEPYPQLLRLLQHDIARSLRRSVFDFAISQTSSRPRHYQALGRRAFVKAATRVDRELAALAGSFDLLLAVTPTNTEASLRRFNRAKQQKPPTFLYRPQTVDPAILKRKLYSVPIERVEDPTLEMIFREKRRELSLKLDLISDRDTRRFLPTGLALYGAVSPDTVATAQELLHALPRHSGRGIGTVSAVEVAARAEVELAHYRHASPAVGATVELHEELTSLMVSGGNLLVGKNMTFPADRVEPLIQHEVGTHVVTHWNGLAQPFRLLSTGLAGYDELQEGLAVFAEYLVAGLTPARLRTIAARVIAARAVVDGAEFIDTFRLLHDEYEFTVRGAFLLATRIHRGGGLVKDAVYLRGLQQVVSYIADGGRLDTFFVGKIAVEHAPVIEELQRREVLVPPPLRPAYLDDPDTYYRLQRVRDGVELVDLAER